MTDAERSEPSEFPPRLQLLMRISGWSALVWGVGVFPYAALQVNGSTATWATYARIASTLIVWTSMLLTLGLAPIILVWTHRLTGQWPWDGYTITSAIRESAGAIGLMEHHGRPGFWAGRWNRLLVILFLVLIGLVTLGAVIGSRHG